MSAKVWFITGTSRGFGREWALAALERGDFVVATAGCLGSTSSAGLARQEPPRRGFSPQTPSHALNSITPSVAILRCGHTPHARLRQPTSPFPLCRREQEYPNRSGIPNCNANARCAQYIPGS